jgi:hypothetical protein
MLCCLAVQLMTCLLLHQPLPCRTAEDITVGADTYLYDLYHFHEYEEQEEKAGAARGSDPDRSGQH